MTLTQDQNTPTLWRTEDGQQVWARPGMTAEEVEAELTAPPPPDVVLRNAKAEALASVITAITQVEAELIGKYSPGERAGFSAKLAEALAIEAGETAPEAYPLVAAEIAVTGRSASETAALIIAKAAVFQQMSGLISGVRQVAETAIDAAETAEEAAAAAVSVVSDFMAAIQ